MKIKFANGTEKKCTAPTEQKLFKSNSENGDSGWVLLLKLVGEITSTELDKLLTPENISCLEFFNETDEGDEAEATPLFTLAGYEKITSSIIRYTETPQVAHTEIQMTKGV